MGKPVAECQAPGALPTLGIVRLSIAGCEPFLALIGEYRAPTSEISSPRMMPLRAWCHPQSGRLLGAESLHTLLQHWDHNALLLEQAQPDAQWHPIDGLQWHEPIQPGQVYCTIGNYRAQVLEAALDEQPPGTPAALQSRRDAVMAALAQRQREGAPYAVIKPTTTISAPYTTLAIASDQHTLDWEVEVGAVIGKTAWQVPVDQALRHVAGYCTVNDITLRQRVFRTDLPTMGTDFLQAKGGPGWLPIGPCLVPAHRISSSEPLHLQLKLNGVLMQDGRCDDMVFSIAEQIAYLSRHVRLEPGDLVCTGSPAGFGQHHRRYLHAGDCLEAEVVGLGAQRIDIQ